jgi:hypothetical protein
MTVVNETFLKLQAVSNSDFSVAVFFQGQASDHQVEECQSETQLHVANTFFFTLNWNKQNVLFLCLTAVDNGKFLHITFVHFIVLLAYLFISFFLQIGYCRYSKIAKHQKPKTNKAGEGKVW